MPSKKPEHFLLLTWLILTGVIVFSLVVAWQENLLFVLYISDKSKISLLITLIYILVTIHCARRIFVMSTQLNDCRQVESIIRGQDELFLSVREDGVRLNEDTILPDCMMTEYLMDLFYRSGNVKQSEGNTGENTDLIGVYESRLKGPQEIGWFVSDMMLKLGLLGTIIGFIFMLGSLAHISDFDINTMQEILRHMSNGMGIALYTTLTGLVCSILAAMQYHMLDRSVDELIEITQHLTHVHVLPKMN